MPNLASTITVISAAPPISRTALMICTHVVPFIPPISTYAIISRPTTAMTNGLADLARDVEQQGNQTPGPGHLCQ